MSIINVGNIIMNTYVYPCSKGYIMVDTGYEHSLKDVETKLGRNGIKLSEIKYVFLTHAHDDHAGFLNELLEKNADLKVIMSNKSMPTLKRGQNSFEGGCSTLLAWIFCKLMGLVGKAEHRFPAIEDKYDGRFIEITDANKEELEKILQGKILFTPGHTADSISLKVKNVIFCGDAAMNDFPSVKRLIIWIEDIVDFEKSWDVLINENAEIIYPAHGRVFPTSDLAKYKKYISKLHLYKLN
ncbi:MAG: MBL fold metallo-hydrolase [Lachnospiraceae bacterium]|nr:MBL fold metallo-hydrolase [Lachnospiraceae bacterium]